MPFILYTVLPLDETIAPRAVIVVISRSDGQMHQNSRCIHILGLFINAMYHLLYSVNNILSLFNIDLAELNVETLLERAK